MKLTKRSGFTLLEIIIVIIIVGVLASLALPRFFAVVEFSRSAEVLQNASVVRQSVERCYLGSGGTYVGCDIDTLDIEDPNNSPGTHFTYVVQNQDPVSYAIVATRNGFNNTSGSEGDQIFVEQDAAGVTRSGTGVFVGIR